MPTTVYDTGLLLLLFESITTPDDIDGGHLIYFGTYGMPEAYFPTTYFPIPVTPVAPPCRTFTIASESRTFTIASDGTGNTVAVEPMGLLLLFANMVVTGTPSGRVYMVEYCTDDN